MGYTTDFIGHIDIEPSLNEDEILYLTAFSESRRCERPGGEYAVPGNPRAEQDASYPGCNGNVPPGTQPGLWCDWVPCWDGCCLSYNGVEKFYAPVPWLRYLIDHFLKPGASAARVGDARFDEFTFDHELDGMVVGCRRDNKELFAITVRRNVVRTEVLRRADRRYLDFPPLPYEQAIDREPSRRRRRRREDGGQVLPFTRPSA
jgi:hypothetical protein